MPKQFVRQASFGAGEFSPRALGRTDIPQYPAGLSQLKNFVVTPQGSATRRPGFKHVGAAKTLDPLIFTERSNSKNIELLGVTWALELAIFCAVGKADGADAYILTSTDGISWTEQTNPKNDQLDAVVWSGSLFCAVGRDDGVDSYIVTSPDGEAWTERANPKRTGLSGVVYSTELSLFVAVGLADGVDAYLITSPDGATWTERSNPKNKGLRNLVWSGSQFVAVGQDDGTDAYIITSPDGTTWIEQENPKNFQLNHIAWNGSQFTAVGTADGTDAYMVTSPDGVTWTEQTNPKNFTLAGILWDGSQFIAVGVADGTDAYMITSPDGITWTEQINPKNFLLSSIAFDGSLLVVVGEADGADAYIVTAPNDTTNRRLIPFIGATGNPYMIEAGHLYMRFFRNEVPVESTPGVTLEITTPWNANDLAEIQLAQANDVMYLVHPSYTPRKLTRTGEATFIITDLMDPTTMAVNRFDSTFKLWDGPYLSENGTVTTITLSGTGTGSKTATASQALFVSTDIGRTLRIFSGVDGSNLWGWGVITAVASPTSATVFMVEDPSTTSAETRWALGAWSATTGFPAAITFYGQRLCFANTAAEPMGVWTSILASFEEFDPTDVDDSVLADNGISITVASKEMLPIKWLEAGFDLMAGTQGGVFRIDGGPQGNQISPQSIRVRLASGYGAASVNPSFIGELLLYTQQAKRIVRGLSPREGQDVLALPDLTLISEHISASGIEEMVFASVPHSIVWMRRGDGLLIGLTINPATQIVAWHSHQGPGSLTGASFPKVISMAVLPLAAHDQLWTVVRRTVNGSTVEHLEAIQLPFDSDQDDQEDALYLDSSVFYDGPATTAISGLSHLEGESVAAYADGIEQGPFTVSSGAITLDTAASTVWVGLDYEPLSNLETLPVKARNLESAKVRIVTTMVEVLDTNGLQVGISAATLSPLNPSLQPDTFTDGDLRPLVTGDREHLPPGNTQTRPTILIRPEGPYPATITGLTHIIEFDHV